MADIPTDTTGIILAGGASVRLGRDKALIDIHGTPIVQRVARVLHAVVGAVLLVTNRPADFAFLDVPMVEDIYPGVGALGGLHAGLSAMTTKYGLVVGCDMPFLNVDLAAYLLSLRSGYEVVMPRAGRHFEPLHAVYAQECRLAFEKHIRANQRRIIPACQGMRIRYLSEHEVARYDPDRLSFFNVNTSADLERMRDIIEHPGRAR